MGSEIYCRHQGTQAGKTRNQRSLTFKCSLATGAFKEISVEASEGQQSTNMNPKYDGLSERYQDTVSSLMGCALW